MLGMRDAEDKVNDFCASTLPFLYSLRRIGMRAHAISTSACGVALTKHTRSIGESVSNGRAELPEYLAQIFLEVLIDLNVLVVAEVFMRQI